MDVSPATTGQEIENDPTGNNLRGIRKMNEDDRKEGKPPQTPRQDRWQDDEFLTAGVRAAREDDRRRAQGRCLIAAGNASRIYRVILTLTCWP